MILAPKSQDDKMSIIARMGIQYIPFELDDIAKEWVRQHSQSDSLSTVDLITMVLGGRARISLGSTNARLLKRLENERQMPLELDFTQSFLSCEDTGRKTHLCLCLINHGGKYDLKLLTETAATRYPVEKKLPVTELSLTQFKELLDVGNFSQSHPTVKRLKHWFAGRVELWGLAYG